MFLASCRRSSGTTSTIRESPGTQSLTGIFSRSNAAARCTFLLGTWSLELQRRQIAGERMIVTACRAAGAWADAIVKHARALGSLAAFACGWRPAGPGAYDEYWGVCPRCKRNDGYLNIRRVHWFVCHRHRVRWWGGENLFSTWRWETDADWKRNARRIRDYELLAEPASAEPTTGNVDGEAGAVRAGHEEE